MERNPTFIRLCWVSLRSTQPTIIQNLRSIASGPPALDSARYAVDFNQVKELVRTDSAIRTADQTEIAVFWAGGANTFTPPGHWNQIAEQVAVQEGNTLLENSRLFPLLNISLA